MARLVRIGGLAVILLIDGTGTTLALVTIFGVPAVLIALLKEYTYGQGPTDGFRSPGPRGTEGTHPARPNPTQGNG